MQADVLKICDTILQLSCRLSQIPAPVATTSGKSPRNVCPPPKTAVPLRFDSEITIQLINSINIKINKIMTQQNFMSSRALTMEELVNVTGGKKLYIRFNSNGDIVDVDTPKRHYQKEHC